MINWVALIVFIFFFVLVTVLGFVASRWRRGDLDLLHEWGLAGRRFGTVVTWFLLGGDLYTAYNRVYYPGGLHLHQWTAGAGHDRAGERLDDLHRIVRRNHYYSDSARWVWKYLCGSPRKSCSQSQNVFRD